LESKSPYVVKNLTGYPIVIWTDASPVQPELVTLEDGKSMNWRFEDWKKIRERVNPIPNKFALQFQGPSWETLKSISVDQEGSMSYALRPAIANVLHRMVVDVKLVDKVKVVTFRSGKVIKNSTNIEIEIALTRSTSDKKPRAQRILPGEIYPIPIESAYHDSIYVRPADFGYKWSMQGIHWRDLIGKKRVRGILIFYIRIFG
jgi:vacuolar protein sorting-associated protein 13A/C